MHFNWDVSLGFGQRPTCKDQGIISLEIELKHTCTARDARTVVIQKEFIDLEKMSLFSKTCNHLWWVSFNFTVQISEVKSVVLISQPPVEIVIGIYNGKSSSI